MTKNKQQLSSSDRRRFLKQTWRAVQAGMALAVLPGDSLFAAPKLGTNPFILGVASGDPTPAGIVLWTRLARDLSEPTSMGPGSIPVNWRVARDERMQQIVSQGLRWPMQNWLIRSMSK